MILTNNKGILTVQFISECNGSISIRASTASGGISYSENLVGTSSGDRCLFYGARIEFKSNVTNFRIPGLIEEETEHNTANVISFLGREFSKAECDQFFNDKEDELKAHWGAFNLWSSGR